MTFANGSGVAGNYAQKFSPKVQEAFTREAITTNAVNHDYDFVGVNAVNIYSVPTVAMTNYGEGREAGSRPGTNRYGAPNDLGTTKQTLTMKVDRAFTFVIDKKDDMDSMGVLNPGKALERQIKNVVIPEVDQYRFAKIVDEVKRLNGQIVGGEIDSSNAYTALLDAKIALMDKKVPMAGCFAYISTNFYKQIRLDKNFIKAGDISQNMLAKGQVGEVDGIPLILVPESYFPKETTTHNIWGHLDQLNGLLGSNKKVEFMLVNKDAVVAAEKLADYKIHDNPPGINGYLVEGRIYYDCFLLEGRKDMIYIHLNQPSPEAP